MLQITSIGFLERSILIIGYVVLALLIRKHLNKNSLKYSMMILWGIVLLRLVIPYTILFQVPKKENTIGATMLFPIIFTNKVTTYLSENISSFLPEVNRIIVMVIVVAYVVFQMIKISRVFRNAKEISIDRKLYKHLIKAVPIKREMRVFINNDLKAPITYGVLNPKIIIQDRILEDEIMLRYVLAHEMTHIKKFDVVWNHLKNILVCIYWYNPFVWLMSNYITEDLEALCDKLVIERTKNRENNKLEYMYVMFQVLTQGKQKKETAGITLKLSPTVERMVILKTMKTRKIGILTMVVALLIFTTAFAHVEETDMPTTTIIGNAENYVINLDEIHFEEDINQDNRTTVVSENAKEDERLYVIADINESCSLESLGGSKTHKFTMYNFYGGVHKNFTTKISNVSSSGRVDYKVVIEEGKNIIFSRSFYGDITLKTEKAKSNRDYKVTVINNSNTSLNYDISIQSYR